jgi:hypothetical protein
MHIIGIGGLKRSGKDTFTRVIADVARGDGFAVAVIAFADAVRQAAAAAYGVDASIFTDDARKETICEAWGITYRQMLINLGEAMRGVDADHWVKAWRRAASAYNKTKCVVCRGSGEDRTQPRVADGGHGFYLDCPACKGAPLPALVLVPDLRRVNEAQAIHSVQGINVLLRHSGVTWDGHINEALAEVAQHRNEALAAKLQCEYAALAAPISISTARRRLFDCFADNPVAAGGTSTDEQREQLYTIAAQILNRL